jgi:hypothetical protein
MKLGPKKAIMAVAASQSKFNTPQYDNQFASLFLSRNAVYRLRSPQ